MVFRQSPCPRYTAAAAISIIIKSVGRTMGQFIFIFYLLVFSLTLCKLLIIRVKRYIIAPFVG